MGSHPLSPSRAVHSIGGRLVLEKMLVLFRKPDIAQPRKNLCQGFAYGLIGRINEQRTDKPANRLLVMAQSLLNNAGFVPQLTIAGLIIDFFGKVLEPFDGFVELGLARFVFFGLLGSVRSS
jgi:hypothetical protein